MDYTFKITSINRLSDYDIKVFFSLFGDGGSLGYSDSIVISSEELSTDKTASETTITQKIEEKCKLYISANSKINLLSDSIGKDFPVK